MHALRAIFLCFNLQLQYIPYAGCIYSCTAIIFIPELLSVGTGWKCCPQNSRSPEDVLLTRFDNSLANWRLLHKSLAVLVEIFASCCSLVEHQTLNNNGHLTICCTSWEKQEKIFQYPQLFARRRRFVASRTRQASCKYTSGSLLSHSFPAQLTRS